MFRSFLVRSTLSLRSSKQVTSAINRALTNAGGRPAPKAKQGNPRKQVTRFSVTAISVFTVCTVVVGYQTRKERNQKIQDLPKAEEVWTDYYSDRTIAETIQIVRRMGLMGSSHSVKAELDDIRKWHQDNGYKGGLVLRDLTKHLFGREDQETGSEEDSLTFDELIYDPTVLNRRECYYLYYELLPTGEIQQQIFCRGTTLFADVLTCLQAKMVYDKELGCRVHLGFRNQADHILKDVVPLLSRPGDRRATIEVCGHSLGAAVGSILAIKLRKRGYRVVRLTTVGEPRFVATVDEAKELLKLLPKDHLRIEHDEDFVPFLPPFGSHIVGNKLWLVNDNSVRFVPADSHHWSDSVWLNFRALEILVANGRPHRIPHYVEQLKKFCKC